MCYLQQMQRFGQARCPVLLLALALAALASAGGCASLEAARHAERGSQAIDAGDPLRAIAELEKAVALEPRAAALHNNLGIAYLAAGRVADARRSFERAVALDCGHEPAQRNLRALREGRLAPQGSREP